MNMNITSRKGRRGNSLVEFGFAITILIPAIIGVFQFGYGFYIYNRLTTMVRTGAQYASIRTYDSNTSTPSAAFTAAVRNIVVYGNPEGSGTTLVPGLQPSHVVVTPIMSGIAPAEMKVALNGFVIDSLFMRWTLSSKPAATFRYRGRSAP